MATHWIWYVIVPLLVIGYTYWHWRRYQGRRTAIRKFAADRGWTYTEREPDLLGRCYGRPFDGLGRRRRAWHAVAGRWNDFDVLSFEYSEVVGSETRSRRYWRQLTGIRLPFPAPEVYAGRRHTLGHLARNLGFTRPGTGDDPFDDDWVTYGTFTPEMKQWVQQHGRNFRVVAGMLETWDSGRFLTERVDPAIADLAELVPLLNAVAGR